MKRGFAGKVSRRDFVRGMGLLAGGVVAATASRSWAGQGKAQGPVNWLSWSVYQLPEVMRGFDSKDGVAVNPIDFEDDAEGYLKIKTSGGGVIDVGMADGFWPVQYYKSGLIEGLDFSELSSAKTLAPVMQNLKMWKLSDGKMLQFPNQWSVEPIVYRKGKVASFDTFEVLWDKRYKGRIIQMDRPSEYMPALAIWLGFKDPFDLTDAELQQMKKKLMEQRPLIKTFTAASSDFVKAMASNEGDLGFCPSPGIAYRIKAAGGGDFGYVVPKQGSVGWVDGNMLVKGAKHRDAALLWIDYFGAPETQAAIAMKTKYPVSSDAAVKVLEQKGQGALVEAAGMKDWSLVDKMTMLKPPKNIEKMTEIWNEYKAG